MKELSVIIVNWNTKDLLRECLKSVCRQNIPMDIFVVDNGSSDKSAGMVLEEFPSVNLKALPKNIGFAKANNIILKNVKTPFVLLLNSDAEPVGNVFSDMIEWMKKHPECGVAGPRLLNADSSLQPSVRRFPTFFSQAFILLKLHVLFPHHPILRSYLAKNLDYSSVQSVDQIKGAAFFISQRAMKRAGILDEGYWIWLEEVDYCKRVKNIGLSVWIVPTVSIIHHQGKSFQKVSALLNQWRMNQSVKHYFHKHHSWLEYVGICILTALSLGLTVAGMIFPRSVKESRGIRK